MCEIVCKVHVLCEIVCKVLCETPAHPLFFLREPFAVDYILSSPLLASRLLSSPLLSSPLLSSSLHQTVCDYTLSNDLVVLAVAALYLGVLSVV